MSRIIISVFWMILGIANGYMLLKRVTPFNAQDLKGCDQTDYALINKYLDGFEIILFIVGVAAVVVWMISMWRRGGQYDRKDAPRSCIDWQLLYVQCYMYLFPMQAVDNRVVSTYFGNIAFAYEDYGLPYCFMASVFNTGIDEPSGYSEENDGKRSGKNGKTYGI